MGKRQESQPWRGERKEKVKGKEKTTAELSQRGLMVLEKAVWVWGAAVAGLGSCRGGPSTTLSFLPALPVSYVHMQSATSKSGHHPYLSPKLKVAQVGALQTSPNNSWSSAGHGEAHQHWKPALLLLSLTSRANLFSSPYLTRHLPTLASFSQAVPNCAHIPGFSTPAAFSVTLVSRKPEADSVPPRSASSSARSLHHHPASPPTSLCPEEPAHRMAQSSSRLHCCLRPPGLCQVTCARWNALHPANPVYPQILPPPGSHSPVTPPYLSTVFAIFPLNPEPQGQGCLVHL